MLDTVIEKLSFNDKIKDLVALLNQKAEHLENIESYFNSHPGGVVKEFQKRRIGIAESYIMITRGLGGDSYLKRLEALKTIVELSKHAKTVAMPVNTARVQIELMKEAVKNRGNKRKQMECLADFTIASFGQESVIRRFLREKNLIEVPETGKELKDLNLGWDWHVHDNLSEGRKTPSQVIVDAFIKGLSKLTLVYYDTSNREIIKEAMDAGKIMGIDVSIGIEFSTGHRYARKHFIYVLPAFSSDEVFEFLEKNREILSLFNEGLEENKKRRNETINNILRHFNDVHLKKINEGYEHDSNFMMQPIKIDDLKSIVLGEHYTRIHLGEIIYLRLKEVLVKRVLDLKLQYEVSRNLFRYGKLTSWELEAIKNKYLSVRKHYQNLTPDDVIDEYIIGPNVMDYDSAFLKESDILPYLRKAGGKVIYIHPLADGLAEAVETIIYNHRYIDCVELINMYDSVRRNPAEIVAMATVVKLLNSGKWEELQNFLQGRNLRCPSTDILKEAVSYYSKMPLVPLAGSDSTGREPHIPGMGFIVESHIPLKCRKHFVKHHYLLSSPAAQVITSQGKGIPDSEKNSPEHRIYSMGKSGQFSPNLVGDEESFEKIGPVRFWRYMNPALKRIIRVVIAMVPATLQIGPAYMALWLGITFFRNVLVDFISASGTRISEWHTKDVNFDYATQSVFWTGFSVPILASVKLGFDNLWPFEHEGPLFEWCKFFFICFANGFYISAHNRLRGFDRAVIRMNFFRSVLAWPFASVFSPIGNIIGIPSIVQAKLWSDVVAGIIEGTGKYRNRMVLRKRDLQEVLEKFSSGNRDDKLTAMLDVLYIWAKQHRGKTALYYILLGKSTLIEKLGKFFKRDDRKNAISKEILVSRIKMLIDAFNPSRINVELNKFIFEKYGKREAVILVRLVGLFTVDFYMWLKKLEKKLEKN